jgi:hypothetical protein
LRGGGGGGGIGGSRLRCRSSGSGLLPHSPLFFYPVEGNLQFRFLFARIDAAKPCLLFHLRHWPQTRRTCDGTSGNIHASKDLARTLCHLGRSGSIPALERAALGKQCAQLARRNIVLQRVPVQPRAALGSGLRGLPVSGNIEKW